MSRPLANRLKMLRALWRRPHRYDRVRLLSMSASLATLAAVPLTGLARVDLWGGHHYLLGSPASFREALAGVIVGITVMYVVTFLSNVVAGRLFCGWGCPVGQISRFGDSTSISGLSRRAGWLAHLEGALFSGFLLVAVLAWWVDLRVLWQGSRAALAVVWGTVLTGVLLSFLHGRYWRWKFCMSACPIGLYYTFMSPARWYGIEFHAALGTCVECNACDNVCPVHLAPRDLLTPIAARPGLSVPDAPGRNHCLECGDCVRACEFIVGQRTGAEPPLTLGLHRVQILPPRTGRASENAAVAAGVTTCG